MTPHESDLRSVLADDADRIDAIGSFAGAAIALDKRRARRRVAVTSAGVAVAAIAVALPLVLSGTRPERLDPVGTTNPSVVGSTTPVPTTTDGTRAPVPVPSDSPAETTQPGPAPTFNSNLANSPETTLSFGPTTGTPHAAYVVNGVFHDGTRTVQLPHADGIQYVARLDHGGVLLYAPAEGRTKPLVVVDESGTTLASFGDVQQVRASGDGTRFATVDPSGTIRLRDSRGDLVKSYATKDADAMVGGVLGDTVYFSRTDSDGEGTTFAWHTTTGTESQVTEGRITAVHAGSSMAIVWPSQDYDPDNTCHVVYDLKADQESYTSCGMFAPTHFTADGQFVVGPEVADGAGAASWKVARVSDAEIVLKVATAGPWAGAWAGGDGDRLVVALLDKEAATKQVLASCSASTRTCTVDTDPVPVSAADRDAMSWPISLSDN